MTPRQLAMLRTIHQFWTEHGYAPSFKDFGLSSTAVAWYNLQQLRLKGFVDYEAGLSRTVRLTDAGRDALSENLERVLP